MANGSLKIAKRNIYTIDLKDEDDNVFYTLSFHLGDTNFPLKVFKLYDDAFKEINNLQEKEEELKREILKEGHEEIELIENITEENIKNKGFELTPAVRKFYYFEAEIFNKIREILDDFLGKGTCQAIFGNYNDKEEFIDFLNGLLGEFEKMGIKIQEVQKSLYKKYVPTSNKVI